MKKTIKSVDTAVVETVNVKKKDNRPNSTTVRFNNKKMWLKFKTFCYRKDLVPTHVITNMLSRSLEIKLKTKTKPQPTVVVPTTKTPTTKVTKVVTPTTKPTKKSTRKAKTTTTVKPQTKHKYHAKQDNRFFVKST